MQKYKVGMLLKACGQLYYTLEGFEEITCDPEELQAQLHKMELSWEAERCPCEESQSLAFFHCLDIGFSEEQAEEEWENYLDCSCCFKAVVVEKDVDGYDWYHQVFTTPRDRLAQEIQNTINELGKLQTQERKRQELLLQTTIEIEDLKKQQAELEEKIHQLKIRMA